MVTPAVFLSTEEMVLPKTPSKKQKKEQPPKKRARIHEEPITKRDDESIKRSAVVEQTPQQAKKNGDADTGAVEAEPAETKHGKKAKKEKRRRSSDGNSQAQGETLRTEGKKAKRARIG